MPSQGRVEALVRRLGIRIKDSTKKVPLPRLSVGQVRRLQALFPVRLLEPGEDVDAYRHYCGAAMLVAELAAVCEPPEGAILDDDDEELTEEAVQAHLNKQNGTAY